MSRIGNQLITVPQSVTVTNDNGLILAKGPKGELTVQLSNRVELQQSDDKITITRKSEEKMAKAQHGLFRSLINNAIIGVSEGYEKKLEMHGVGFRAAPDGQGLVLNVGFSHPIKIAPVEGISFKVEKNVITVSGIDKHLVGQVSANIRSIKKPEPYKGKGIRYQGEYIRRKPGKAAKAGAE